MKTLFNSKKPEFQIENQSFNKLKPKKSITQNNKIERNFLNPEKVEMNEN